MELGSGNRGSDMATNGPDVRVYTGQYDHTRGSGRQYVWTDDAACNGVDPKYFEYNPQGKREEEIRNLKYGQSLCSSCPVAQMCLDLADEADTHFTTRGGYLPTVVDNPYSWPRSSGAPRESHFKKGNIPANKGMKMPEKKFCKRGHSNWKPRKNGRQCVDCNTLRNKARYSKTAIL